LAATVGSATGSGKSAIVLVPFLGTLFLGVGFLFLGVSSGISGFGLIIALFGVVFLASAALIWRKGRIGYVVAIVMSALVLALFGPTLPASLISFADQGTFLSGILFLPALLITLIYGVLGLRAVWRKGATPKPGRGIPVMSVLALLTVGFMLGGASIGLVAGGVVTNLVASSNVTANITIVSGASNAGVAQPYSPANYTVKVGTTVVWANKDTVTHTVTSTSVPNGASSFDSGNLPYGYTFKVTFTMAGTYQYYCAIHPSMTGTIRVTP
jgi:plastocyanin